MMVYKLSDYKLITVGRNNAYIIVQEANPRIGLALKRDRRFKCGWRIEFQWCDYTTPTAAGPITHTPNSDNRERLLAKHYWLWP
jgi:hypothetical protein